MSYNMLAGGRPKTKALARFVWLGLIVFAWSGSTGFGQSILSFQTGETRRCRVLEYANGAFVVELPDGSRRTVQQENIARIQFESPISESLPSEFGLADETAPAASAPTPAVSTITTNSSRLVLVSQWQSRLGRGNLSLGDAAHLLSKCGTPQVDLVGKNIAVWNNITYLMPVQEAKKRLNLGISTRSAMTCAAFPPDSFFFHEFSGNYEDGFKRLYLITDYADQVVGVQLQDNTSKAERWFPYTGSYSADWGLYNFVNNRKKANSNWMVGVYVCKGGQAIMGYPPSQVMMQQAAAGQAGANEGVIRVDTELFSITRDRYNILTDEKSRERVRLLLAQPVVDLMLYVVQQAR